MTVLRSLLFVPGNRADMLTKAANLTPDAFVPDMEDSVPIEEKINARTITAACVPLMWRSQLCGEDDTNDDFTVVLT